MNAAHCWESDHTAVSDGRGWPQQEPGRTTASLERSYHREGGIWPSDPDWRSSFRNGPTVDTRNLSDLVQVTALVIVEKGSVV